MKKIFAVITVVCLLACITACTDANTTNTDAPELTSTAAETTPAQTESAAAFEVSVVDADGNAVSGVMIQICKDVCVPSVTDANGVATFNIEITDEHKLSVLSCPEGYVYNGEDEVYLEDGLTEYVVELEAE